MERSRNKRSRTRSRSPPPWRRQRGNSTSDRKDDRARPYGNSGRGYGRGRGNFPNQHQRRNQEQEDRQMKNWMSQEDDFVLKQSKKKARIRIKEGRAKLIDRLVLILSIIDLTKDPLEDDLDHMELDVRDPTDLIEESSVSELRELEKEVEHYLVLEHHETNRTFWEAIKSICNYKCQSDSSHAHGRSIGLVSADVDRLLGPKTLEQLQVLELQVHQKLKSNEPIDEEYWEQLLESITLYKAKAHLGNVYASVKMTRLNEFREQQIRVARQELTSINNQPDNHASGILDIRNTEGYDTLPQLKLRSEDQALEMVEEEEFRARIGRARMNVSYAGHIAGSTQRPNAMATQVIKSVIDASKLSEDHSLATNLMYDREAAKGVEEDEEVFAGEAEVVVESNPLWSGKYRPRKPKHFNRVQMGYEWNKYNQTHYDHDNPPPKVVQGYKFNVFYPELIDKNKAPTYRIDRENGRKKGQSLAPAGEEDTCLIRFISGPPYEDIAFRIVDREWDHSAKRERGFKSSFDKGVLQLHFQFKKIYYRK